MNPIAGPTPQRLGEEGRHRSVSARGGAPSRRTRVLAAIAIVLLVLVPWTLFELLLSFYPVYPWDWAFWTGRQVIRVVFAALTGQSTDVDLLPG
jgi:hypothetical protein